MPWLDAELSRNKLFCLITGASLGLKNMYKYTIMDQKNFFFLKCLLGVKDFFVSIFGHFPFFRGKYPTLCIAPLLQSNYVPWIFQRNELSNITKKSAKRLYTFIMYIFFVNLFF